MKDYSKLLTSDEWHALKTAILCAYYSGVEQSKEFDRLPEILKRSEPGKEIESFLAGDKDALNRAASLMTGGDPRAWMALEKS